MKLADYVARFLAYGKHPFPDSDINPLVRRRVYAVCGAGAMHLNDAICHHPLIDVVAMHHEQAATFAAEAEARVTNRLAVVHVTAGPGGTNTLTGLACAYVDSIPLLVIAGQVTSTTLARAPGLRQMGMNELDMVALAQPVTKYARTVTEPFLIRYCLEKAIHSATSGRPGPAWLEIPLDVQAAEVDPDRMTGFDPAVTYLVDHPAYLARRAIEVATMLAEAERPVLIVGNGVRLSGGCAALRALVEHLRLPVISSWNASDIIDNGSPYYIGRMGLFGDRASNLAVQNADLILAIGARLSVGQIGHAPSKFAPNARKIVVDIDGEEMHKGLVIDLPVIADAGTFMTVLLGSPSTGAPEAWWRRLVAWTGAYGFDVPRQPCALQAIDAYDFVTQLEKHLAPDAIVLTDVGFSFIPAMQTLKVKQGQRLFHSSGVSPMGWALPACIGARMAAPERQVVCLTGDGGAMLNLQELQTLVDRRLPVAILLFANDGYATMRITQQNHFGRDAIAGPGSGLSLPDFIDVAQAFGLYVMDIHSPGGLANLLPTVLDTARRSPVLAVLHMAPDQVLSPRVVPRVEGGKFLPTDIADMWPHLDRVEFARCMRNDDVTVGAA